MNDVLSEILSTGYVKTIDGESVKLHSHISGEQGQFLQEIIEGLKPKVTLEVGLAYGISALYICEALEKLPNPHHIVIDPYQKDWQEIGLYNLDKAGYKNIIDFYARPSHLALPQLESQGIKIDFAFIDGQHTFDNTLIDFFYIDRLLNIGGVLVIDDTHFPSIRKVCRFIVTNRSYSVFRCLTQPKYQLSWKRQLIKKAAQICRPIAFLLKPEYVNPDLDLGLVPQTRCIAFKKEAEDQRRWDFHREF